VFVDAYAHCGREKYLPVEALDAVMSAADVSCAVLCQHLGQFDNSYIASLVEGQPGRFAGVALIDHESRHWDEQLDGVTARGFRGLRITGSALLANSPLAESAASAGLALVIYAPEGVGPLVAHLLELATAHPQVSIIVSHLGNPTVAGDQLRRGEEVLVLAEVPNVYVLLSGLGMFCPFPYKQLDTLIASVVETFGADRVMWGSNYPVGGEDVADYRRDLDLVQAGIRWGIDRSAAEAICETTARRVWFG
jgi:L-fuconolactonase